MNEKFLNKVVGQIVSETEMDYENRDVYAPFLYNYYSSLYYLSLYRAFTPFRYHCEDVYGLNKNEIEYVWERWLDIVSVLFKRNG
jgi:hypothetical protein